MGRCIKRPKCFKQKYHVNFSRNCLQIKNSNCPKNIQKSPKSFKNVKHSFRKVPVMCKKIVEQVSKKCAISIQKVSKNCPKIAQKFYKRCPKSIPKVSKKCPKSVQKVSQKCPKSVPKVSKKCPKSVQKVLNIHNPYKTNQKKSCKIHEF